MKTKYLFIIIFVISLTGCSTPEGNQRLGMFLQGLGGTIPSASQQYQINTINRNQIQTDFRTWKMYNNY